MLPQPSGIIPNPCLKPQNYHVFALLDPPKVGCPSRIFLSFAVWKRKKPLCFTLFFCSKATRFFFGFFWLPPGSERQQNLQANESDCECFMGLCDRFGGENHKSLIFWVWPLTGCQWSQDHYIFTRGFLCKPSFTTVTEGGAHTQLIFQTKKSFNKKSVSWLMIPYTPPKFNIDPVEMTIFEAGGASFWGPLARRSVVDLGVVT